MRKISSQGGNRLDQEGLDCMYDTNKLHWLLPHMKPLFNMGEKSGFKMMINVIWRFIYEPVLINRESL
jgi:hypothetical protein